MLFDNKFLFEQLDKKYEKSRASWDDIFSSIVKIVSYRSSCAKTKQAALIVKNNRIISLGINGPVSGDINCIELENGESICGKDSQNSCLRAIHAEQNAISYSNMQGVSVFGSTIYCTMTPCISCARLLVASGIKIFKYLEEYRLTEGLDFLKQYNVETVKLEI